jgi:hypothetical protein
MRPGLIGLVVFLFILGVICSIPMTGTNLFQDPNAMAATASPLGLIVVWTQADWGALVNPLNWPGYFSDIYQLAVLNLPIFGDANSPYQLARWVFLAPIIAALVITLIVLGMSFLYRSV